MIVRKSGGRWLPIRIEDFSQWLSGLLEEAAHRLGAVVGDGECVYRWGSAGAPVSYHGEYAWLRVRPFLEHEMDRTAWLGTADAALIEGMRKPELLARTEWRTAGPVPVPVSAEIMTLVTDPVASPDRFLHQDPVLDPSWLNDLTASLMALARYPTTRRFGVHAAEPYAYLLSATYRQPVPASLVLEFGTEHVDLNWSNITVPVFQIIDMEHWCHAVTGYGAAYLYLTSLAVPAAAARLRATLASILDSPSGRYAQLVAAAILLRDLTRLPDPDRQAAALHRHTDMLLHAPSPSPRR
jgi:hypothetical protein